MKPFDREKWKDRERSKCGEPGHPPWSCPNDDADGDAKSQVSQASSMKKLAKELKSIKKSFIQLQKTKENESDSDISASNELQGESQEESHFQFEAGNFQFAQVEHEFEPPIAKLFQLAWKNTKTVQNNVEIAQASGNQLDLRKVILFDSQSTMDLFCNRAFVNCPFHSNKSMRALQATVAQWWSPSRQRCRDITQMSGTIAKPSPIFWLYAMSSSNTALPRL
jgi:hypothetical protein